MVGHAGCNPLGEAIRVAGGPKNMKQTQRTHRSMRWSIEHAGDLQRSYYPRTDRFERTKKKRMMKFYHVVR